MKRRLILVLIGALVTLSCYSQNGTDDSDRNEYRDSVVNNDLGDQEVREETAVSDDTTEHTVPSRENNDMEVSPPSKGTGSPGLTGKGAYDVDGKVNGELEIQKKKEDAKKAIPENSKKDSDVE